MEVAGDGGDEVFDIYADSDEDVQGFDVLCCVDGHQTAVPVVNEEVAPQGPRGVVIYTAGAVGHVTHDQCVYARAEASQDIRDERGEE